VIFSRPSQVLYCSLCSLVRHGGLARGRSTSYHNPDVYNMNCTFVLQICYIAPEEKFFIHKKKISFLFLGGGGAANFCKTQYSHSTWHGTLNQVYFLFRLLCNSPLPPPPIYITMFSNISGTHLRISLYKLF